MSLLDDITPDAGDPTTGMILGLLGGLGKAATPLNAPAGMGVNKLNKLSALFGTLGAGAEGIQGGMQGAQQYRANNLANQSAGIDLQNKQMLNPVMMQARMNALQGISNPQNPTGLPQQPGSLSGGLTPYQQNAQMMINSAQRHFGITGDDKPLTDAWKSAFENDPSLAAEKEKQKGLNSVQTTPNGPMAGYQIPGLSNAPGGSGSPGLFGSLAPNISSALMKGIVADREPAGAGPGNQQPPDRPSDQFQGIPAMQGLPSNGQPMPQGGQAQQPPMPPQMGMQPPIQPVQQGAPTPQPPPQQDPRQAAFMPPPQAPAVQVSSALQNVAKGTDGKPLIAGDGQPVLPSLAGNPFYRPDPTMTPKFNTIPTSNTTTAVDAAKTQNAQQVKDLSEGNQSFTEASSSLSTEQYTLKQVASLLQATQSGTAMAQWPELAKQAASLGIISDPSTIKNLGDLQAAIALSAKETLNNIKDNAATIGGPSMRIFGSEVNAQIKNGINIENQPAALYKMVTSAGGLVNQHLDLINGWQKIGGSGNRAAGGNTMLPTDYTQQFLASHPADKYRQAFEAQTAPFKGMAQSTPATKVWQKVDGKWVQQ